MSAFFKKHKKTMLILLAAFLLPLVITCIAFYIKGVAPFGDTSVLLWDSKLQYKDYFGYLWDVLHGNASLDYSAAKSLGGKMVGLVAYYLTCPLNLLIYFFKKSEISLFFSISTMLKIAFAGLTSAYFVKKRFNIHPAAVVLLSTSYALMEYNVYYSRNIMWLDGVVMLPLICLGVYELLHNNKKGLLFFSVATVIISNWYSGYMACLMGGFYFIFELVLKYDWKNFKNVIGKALLDCVRVGADMILGVLGGAVVLLPACMSLVGGKATFRLIYASMNFSFLQTFTGFDINATVNTKTSPILYCGGLALLLVVYFFFDKKVELKTRLTSIALFLFMLLGFSFKEFELMWTAFVQSHSYNFRFAFVFAFVMILIAAMAIRSIEDNGNKIDKTTMYKALGVIVGVALLLDLSGKFNNRFVANVYLFIFAFYAFFLFFVYSGKDNGVKKNMIVKSVSVIAVAGLLALELGVNSLIAYKDYSVSDSQFSSYVENMTPIVEEMKEKDKSFYRFEKNYSYLTEVKSDVATCESLLFGYNSIENYSSTYDPNVDEFFATMGYSDSTYVPDENSKDNILFPTDSYWNSPMLLMDSVLGIKYQLAKEQTFGMEKYDMTSEMPNDYSMYKNPYALPMAYNVSSNLEQKPSYTLNPFENQKMFISEMLGQETNVYVEPETEFLGYGDRTETFELTAKTDGPMYVYVDGTKFHSDDYKKNCELYVNGEYVQNMCQRFLINAEYIGDYNKGDVVTVQIKHVSKENDKHNLYSAQLDKYVFEDVYNKLSTGYKTDLNIDGNVVSGTYETDKDSTVMISLPYVEGWKVLVDGKEVQYKELAGTFIGIDLTAGSHNIEMEYKTPYLNYGIAGSVVGVVGFAGWCVVDALIRKKKLKNV